MSALARLIEHETGLLRQLVEKLEEEQKALIAARPDSLEMIAGEKLALVQAINRAEAERNRLSDPPLPADGPGMAAWFAAHPAERQAAALWQELMAATRAAHDLHEQNGRLIALLSAQTGEALTVLRGLQQGPGLYGSDGQAASASASRIVDSA